MIDKIIVVMGGRLGVVQVALYHNMGPSLTSADHPEVRFHRPSGKRPLGRAVAGAACRPIRPVVPWPPDTCLGGRTMPTMRDAAADAIAPLLQHLPLETTAKCPTGLKAGIRNADSPKVIYGILAAALERWAELAEEHRSGRAI